MILNIYVRREKSLFFLGGGISKLFKRIVGIELGVIDKSFRQVRYRTARRHGVGSEPNTYALGQERGERRGGYGIIDRALGRAGVLLPHRADGGKNLAERFQLVRAV